MAEYIGIIAGFVALLGSIGGIVAFIRSQSKSLKEDWQADLDRAVNNLGDTIRNELKTADDALSDRIDGFQTALTEAQATFRDQLGERIENAVKDVNHEIRAADSNFQSANQRLDDRANNLEIKISEAEMRLRDLIETVNVQAKTDNNTLNTALETQIEAKYSELKVTIDLHSHGDQVATGS